MSKRSQASRGPTTDSQPMSKRSRRSRDDLSGNTQLPNRTRSKENRALTEKQAANDQASKDAEIAQLRKQLARSQKSNEQQRVLLDTSNRTEARRKQQYYDDYQRLHGRSPPESESEDNVNGNGSDSDDGESSSHFFPTSLHSKGTQSPEPLIIRTKGAARPTATIPRLSFVSDGDEVNVRYHGESTMMAPYDRRSSPAHSPSASPSLSSHSARPTAPPIAPSHTQVGRESQHSDDTTATLAAVAPSPPVGSDPPTSSVAHPTDNPSVPAATPLPPSQITGSKGDKLSHYKGRTKTVLRKAIRGYEGRLGAINMCPEEDMQSSWAQEEWRIRFESDEQLIKLSDEMLKLIRKCGVRVRSFVRDQIKPLIRPAYGFIAGAESANTVRENKQKCVELMTALGFYYKDATTRTGYFNSPILFDAISRAFFYNKDAPGLAFPERFNPIPIPALAFIFTVIEHCLNEWSTGSYKALIFNETEASVRYHEHHLPAVKGWTEISPDLTTVLRKAWYTKARKQAGAASLQTPAAPLKLSDSARDLAYEEMKAMAAALDEEPQAEGEGEEEAE
ncbi:hypothetical protein EV421DRAFT_1963923 [Armillaria borealis]|uniref:DUF6532 domain-containing protein n=1 Tax=Armillaria borealis TaxID=47425 RepID=A0AA39JBZ3_9AGAR|nr:hypothetical protein EV421DRAFT_1963923 [Armillaria borealis]